MELFILDEGRMFLTFNCIDADTVSHAVAVYKCSLGTQILQRDNSINK